MIENTNPGTASSTPNNDKIYASPGIEELTKDKNVSDKLTIPKTIPSIANTLNTAFSLNL